MTVESGSIIRDVLVGVGVFLCGAGIFLAMLALARMLRRVNVTLDGIDRQVEAIGAPVAQTLTHVDGIAETAEGTLERIGGAVRSLESAAGNVSKTTSLAKAALTPAIVNAGAALGGISAGLRRLVTGKNSKA